MYPGTQVMTTETGFDRDYTRYPYGDYRTNDAYLIFPVTNPDDRLPEKERVHGVIVGDQAKVYRFDAFANGTTLLLERFGGEEFIVLGNASENWIVSFRVNGDASGFQALQGEGAIVMEDEAGNRYDVFGRVIDGPAVGSQLEATQSYIAYWFAWGTFFPDAEIF